MKSMAGKVPKPEERPKQPLLLKMTHEEAKEKLSKRVAEAIDIIETPVSSPVAVEQVKTRFNKWNDYNLTLLNSMFTSEEIAVEYSRVQGTFRVASDWFERYENHNKLLQNKMNKIESIIDRLELFTVSTDIQHSVQQSQPNQFSQVKVKPQTVFIGHGRSKLWGRVKSFLHDDYGIDSFTFESESHAGEPIVPILEGFLEKASFAILILTAEDETPDGKSRARQNVVHEAGLFQGRLGFKKAILLRQAGLDDFSNVDGLQYIGFTGDDIEQTFYELGRVLKREGVVK